MLVAVKKLHWNAMLPVKAHDSDAGFDLFAHRIDSDDKWKIVYGTGIAVSIPQGYVGLIFMRSSVRDKCLSLANAVGVIDSGYTGEIMLTFREVCDGFSYKVGEKIGQLVIMQLPQIEIQEVDELPKTQRGTGGHGSTGH